MGMKKAFPSGWWGEEAFRFRLSACQKEEKSMSRIKRA
jgi:hypothetical protein